MPKNDTWHDGSVPDTMGEIDSTGSCDSVVSFNSCFSDDSLEFLSAEEKACLTFLEETIQSLDTEDDSGLSNDEPDQIPARGNVATKASRLSASIGLNKPPVSDIPKRHFENPSASGSPGKHDILNYMVPTPFILAHRPTARIKNLSNAENAKPPPEVNVVVKAPPHKPESKNDTHEESLNKPQNASRRGPLSYEGLVQLRKTTSVRKTNPAEAKPEEQLLSTSKINPVTHNLKLKSEGHTSPKPIPPPVAPKPKIKPPTQPKAAVDSKTDPNSTHTIALSVDNLMNPEKVRLEALCKLGLFKGTKGQSLISQQPLPPRVAPKPGKAINPLHQQHTSMTSAGKATTLERSNHRPSSYDITESNTASEEESSPGSFSVPVHSVGKDRREALQKLGLLKN